MRKIPLLLIAAGFVFCYVSAPFMGVDLLIDAVGFLLIFNGANGLRKLGVKTGPAPWLALALVLVAALQLFFALLPLAVLRAAGEIVLFALLVRAARPAAKGIVRVAAWPAFCLGALATGLAFGAAFYSTAAATAAGSLSLAGHLLLGLWFALAAFAAE